MIRPGLLSLDAIQRYLYYIKYKKMVKKLNKNG